LVAYGAKSPTGGPVVGLIVGKSVGSAVVRNKVKRRLRALAAGAELPSGAALVLRALPKAGQAKFAVLAKDFAKAVNATALWGQEDPA
jgi:ribonuclease P protein component